MNGSIGFRPSLDVRADDDRDEDSAPSPAPGEVVVLKSGGPLMTVVANVIGDKVRVMWHDPRDGGVRLNEYPAVAFARVSR